MAGLRLSPRVRAILEDADQALDWDCKHNQSKLYEGILLNQGTKKFWLDEKNKHNFIIYARGLSILWVEDARFWKWTTVLLAGFRSFEAAELIRVSRLHIRGKIKISHLSLGHHYEVVFVVLIKNEATGWFRRVNLELNVGNWFPQRREEDFDALPRERWIEVKVGTFMVTEHDNCAGGEVEFSLFEHGGQEKTGLLVKCAIIRPRPVC